MNSNNIIKFSIFIVFLGLLTALYYRRVDHIYRTSAALLGLSLPLWVPKVYNPSEGIVRKVLSPIYDDRVMIVFSIFIAVHVSLVNVPFTTVDLFHKEWRDADVISHFLGGMTIWMIIASVLREFKLNWRKLIFYSILLFYTLAIGWEILEKLSESQISFIAETLQNKIRDVISDSLGMLLGIIIEKERITSYQQS
ncbi:hypothetical protein [Pyrococcus horikoshii]|uniref:Uncharacterized protein n=1 Tax=Pyrococcus horikoshii TaxID=53953 RepID=A0A832W742_PYRHR|nr:hypothetical protein [Pyrococcus horikoshii]HII60543.1 hypothetical protein [Pyrococcus horikoshii]